MSDQEMMSEPGGGASLLAGQKKHREDGLEGRGVKSVLEELYQQSPRGSAGERVF